MISSFYEKYQAIKNNKQSEKIQEVINKKNQKYLAQKYMIEVQKVIEKGNQSFGKKLNYLQPFSLMHITSTKYLSIKNTQNQQPILADNSLRWSLQETPDEFSILNFAPSVMYWNEIQNNIYFDIDQVYITCQQNNQTNYLYASRNQNNQYEIISSFSNKSLLNVCLYSSSQADINYIQGNKKQNDQEENIYNNNINLDNENEKSSKDKHKQFMQYGDLLYLESPIDNKFLNYKIDNIKSDNFFLKQALQRIDNEIYFKIILAERQNQLQLEKENLVQRDKSEKLEMISISHQNLYFQKSIWKIENKNRKIGDIIKFDDIVRFKSIQNNEYLSIDHQELFLTTTKAINNWSLFQIIDPKKIYRTIDKKFNSKFNQNNQEQRQLETGFMLYLKHIKTNSFLSMQRDSDKISLVLQQEENPQDELFKFNVISEFTKWEIYYMKNILSILQISLFLILDAQNNNNNTINSQRSQSISARFNKQKQKQTLEHDGNQNSNRGMKNSIFVLGRDNNKNNWQENRIQKLIIQKNYVIFKHLYECLQKLESYCHIHETRENMKNKEFFQETQQILKEFKILAYLCEIVCNIFKHQEGEISFSSFIKDAAHRNTIPFKITRLCYKIIGKICYNNMENQSFCIKYLQHFTKHIAGFYEQKLRYIELTQFRIYYTN
ncbi:MIR motif [Pseudocohnilembus persalinus]|uniref:MIR motif n=1 Tax=Pseudocohnilembus persalinus TaxID=266149 RepID=A0A0V0R909_PSEPJ|nr:MIR motif [Pseudocohnilembus persalinus]|eukprot:KRX10930.1 MIR motif [Pseudocohnilembus persalinus]